ncbi:hypothetical protein J6590_056721 [Homalodisca vitripennis]|nr:hypothetical protein J6590_056721 [Homalodisca vitripennis]
MTPRQHWFFYSSRFNQTSRSPLKNQTSTHLVVDNQEEYEGINLLLMLQCCQDAVGSAAFIGDLSAAETKIYYRNCSTVIISPLDVMLYGSATFNG